MAESGIDFEAGLADLRGALARQGELVRRQVEAAFDAVFDRNVESARLVMRRDDEVDREDVRIEQQSVELLLAAAQRGTRPPAGASGEGGAEPGTTAPEGNGAGLTAAQLRGLLTIVKVNNELERIADAATFIAERVISLGQREDPLPETTRVMTNSVIGILRDANDAFGQRDPKLAKVVLASEDTVKDFRRRIARKAEERVADGRMSVDVAFDLGEIVSQATMIADHCTNIAEQVIYECSGAIVRHMEGRWREISC